MTTKPARAFASITTKLFGAMCALMLGLVAMLGTYFPAQHVASVSRDLERKADTYGRLLAREVESAIAFDDRQTVREIFDATAVDTDVRAVALYAQDGRALYVLGELDGPSPAALRLSGAPVVELFPTAVRCTSPVISREGPRGTLVLELSTASLESERTLARRSALGVGLGALASGLLAAWLFARSLGARIRAIARVTSAVAEGNLAVPPLTDPSSDEVGQLARSFDEMVARIRGLMDHISATAAQEQERLGALVASRTFELDRRNADMRLVLDSVGEGFFTLDREGRMSRERSAVVEAWLGPVADNATFWECLARVDQDAADWFKVSFEAVLEDWLPPALALEQMPKRLRKGALHYGMRYTPIFADGVLDQVLVVLSDITSEVARERAESSRRDLLNVFEHVMNDRAGLVGFLDEGDDLVGRIQPGRGERASTMRAIHTLKGSSSLIGLSGVTRLCDEIESRAAESGSPPSDADRAEIQSEWQKLSGAVRSMIDGGCTERREVRASELEKLRRATARGRPRDELLALMNDFDREPAEHPLARLAEHARAVAARLDKPPPVVRVEAGGVRLDPLRFRPLWSALVHAVRNAVDHGIEPADARARAGKPDAGAITLRARQEGTDVVLEIADDGRGIDWDEVARRARDRGLPHATPEDLEEALFDDGLTTRETATECSGRGVGLGAVREACRDLGGTLVLRTRASRGTTMILRIPAMAAADRGVGHATSLPPSAAA